MKSRHARRVPEYLQHILDAIDRASAYVAGMDLEAFERDTRTQDAVIRSIEIVGEAANKTRLADPEFAARFPDVPWDVIYGMRNRIVHDYFEVDLESFGRRSSRICPRCACRSRSCSSTRIRHRPDSSRLREIAALSRYRFTFIEIGNRSPRHRMTPVQDEPHSPSKELLPSRRTLFALRGLSHPLMRDRA